MNEQPFEHQTEVPATDYGRWRREVERARQEESVAVWDSMFTSDAIEEHRPTSAHLRAAHRGLYDMTPQDMGRAVAGCAPMVGQDYGQGRALERRGGTFDHATEGPAPGRVDLTGVNTPPGYRGGELSSLERWRRENR